MILSSHDWRRAADAAWKGRLPIDAWIAFSIEQHPAAGPAQYTSGTVGLDFFMGLELGFVAAPLTPQVVSDWTCFLAYQLPVERADISDGDTLPIKGDSGIARIRSMKSRSPDASDHLRIFHPDCPHAESDVLK